MNVGMKSARVLYLGPFAWMFLHPSVELTNSILNDFVYDRVPTLHLQHRHSKVSDQHIAQSLYRVQPF